MKKVLVYLFITLFPSLAVAQQFGFSHEMSSYTPAGSSEVQFPGISATLCRNKATGNLVATTGSNVILINENNGTVISRFGSDDNIYSSILDITTDDAGNFYILIASGVIKCDANGVFLSSWGGLGGGDGLFNNPESICTDNSNNIYVADAGNKRVQKFNSQGNFLTKWGTNGTANGQFLSPKGIAYWPVLDQIIVGDFFNSSIQSFTINGTFIAKAAVATGVRSIDIDVVNDRLLVLGSKISSFDSNLTLLTTWGLNGAGGTNANFVNTTSLAVSNNASRVFVVDNFRLVSYSLGGGSTYGSLSTSYGSDGTVLGRFDRPRAADYSRTGSTFYVVDWGKTNPVTQVTAATLNIGTSTKTPSTSPMKLPWMLWTDLSFQYVFDFSNVPTPSNHYEVHKFDLNNVFQNTISFGIINAATMTMDRSGNFYFAKQSGSIYNIYKFNSSGAMLAHPTNPVSWISTPSIGSPTDALSLAIDSNDNLYATYADNSTSTTSILKYNSAGTLIATLGSRGNTDGLLGPIVSIDVDDNGNIYVLEVNRFQVFDASFNFLQKVSLTPGVKPGSVYQPILIRANAAIAQGNTTKAKALLTEALLNSNKIGDRVLPQDVYYQLWKLIESKNEKLALLYYQNQYLLMRDTMKSLDWRVRKMN